MSPTAAVRRAAVLHELQDQTKTGLLYVSADELTSVFFIERGALVFVRGNDVEQRLDRVLLRLGRITQPQHEEAARRRQDEPSIAETCSSSTGAAGHLISLGVESRTIE